MVILVNIQIPRGMFFHIYMFTFLVSSNHWVLVPMRVSRVVVCTIASLRILPFVHRFPLDDHSLGIVDRFPVMRSFPLQRMKNLSFQHQYTMMLGSQTSKEKKTWSSFFSYWITSVDFSHPDFECELPSPSLWRCSDFICNICIFISTIYQQYGEILIYIYMYAFIQSFIRIHIHTIIYSHAHTFIHTYTRKSIGTKWKNTYNAFIQSFIHIETYIHTHT